MERTRPQSLIGALSQSYAALMHRVSVNRLHSIGMTIPKVLIITGDEDHLVHPRKSHYLAKHIPGAELVEWKSVGHVINQQKPAEFHEVLERVFKEGRDRVNQGLPSSMQ